MEGGGLYRLLRKSVGVPVGFAVALGCDELIESFECLCDCSDTAHKQNYFPD
jgi:hypothetical protein